MSLDTKPMARMIYLVVKKQKKTSAKIGRPPTTGGIKMRSIRVPDDEWNEWIDAADKQNRALGQWIRDMLNRAAKRS